MTNHHRSIPVHHEALGLPSEYDPAIDRMRGLSYLRPALAQVGLDFPFSVVPDPAAALRPSSLSFVSESSFSLITHGRPARLWFGGYPSVPSRKKKWAGGYACSWIYIHALYASPLVIPSLFASTRTFIETFINHAHRSASQPPAAHTPFPPNHPYSHNQLYLTPQNPRRRLIVFDPDSLPSPDFAISQTLVPIVPFV